MCQRILYDLTRYHETSIRLSPSILLDLKLFSAFQTPTIVHGFDVPVLIVPPKELACDGWDLTIITVRDFMSPYTEWQLIYPKVDSPYRWNTFIATSRRASRG